MTHANDTAKLCECGCGLPTPLAPRTDRSRGWVKGEPRRFIFNHQGRKSDRYTVVDRGFATPCWELDVVLRSGYARIGGGDRKTKKSAHVAYWERINGAVPGGTELHHRCENKSCVNPEHLTPVTHTENMRLAKHVVLTMDDAIAIRNMHGTMFLREIAELFGVSVSQVHRIVHDESWR